MKHLLFPVLLLLVACGGGTTPEQDPDGQPAQLSAEEMRIRIGRMEDSLWTRIELDKRGALSLQSVYLAFAKAYPKDTVTPEYVFRAAGTAHALGNSEESVRLYDRIILEYPDWSRLVNAYYMKAFTIDTGLKEKGRAQQAYEQVIMIYPDHPFAEQARSMIALLYLSEDELLEYLKKKNEGSADIGR